MVRAELLHILALLTLESPVAEEAGAWALGVLASDEDTEAIRILAGLPSNAPREEIAPWLRRAAHDLGVPIGEERANWDPDVLREKDREICAYEEACREQMVPDCRALAARVDRELAWLTEFFTSAPR
jgi:hypothetical protein